MGMVFARKTADQSTQGGGLRTNMKSALELNTTKVADLPLQEASLSIWDTKYRLQTKTGDPVDKDIQGTYERVACALADVEDDARRDYWYERFVWALQRGAIPAGRIISNAGAEAPKQMVALAGRANYVDAGAYAGVPDPGAKAVAALVGALVGHVEAKL